MFVFRGIWRVLFSCNTRFEIRPFALLPTLCSILINLFIYLFIIPSHSFIFTIISDFFITTLILFSNLRDLNEIKAFPFILYQLVVTSTACLILNQELIVVIYILAVLTISFFSNFLFLYMIYLRNKTYLLTYFHTK